MTDESLTEQIKRSLADNDAGPGWPDTTLTWCAGFLAERFDGIQRPISGPGSETMRVSMMVRWVRWAQLIMTAWPRDRDLLRQTLPLVAANEAEDHRSMPSIEWVGWRTRQHFEVCQPTDLRITIDGRVLYLYAEEGPPHIENQTHRHDIRTEQGRADRQAEGRRVRDLPQA